MKPAADIETKRKERMALDQPRVINLEVTNHCNLACPMCARTIHVDRGEFRPLAHLPVKTIERIFEEAARHHIGLRLHQFGEILMHPQLAEILELGVRTGVRYSVSTNATLLNDKNARLLLHSNMAGLTISIDAATAETYNQVRARPTGQSFEFEEVCARIERFLQLRREEGSRLKVMLVMVDMPIKAAEKQRFIDRWTPYMDDPSVKLHFAGFTDFGGIIDNKEQFGFDDTPDRVKTRTGKRKACGEPFRDMTINAVGLAVACCFDSKGEIVLGDAGRDSVLDIWHSETYRAFRADHAARRFDHLPLCDGCGGTWKS